MPRLVEPEVYAVARTTVEWDELQAFLIEEKGEAWYDRVSSESSISDGEHYAEFAGKGCYGAWDVGLNPNVTRVRTDTAEYLWNLAQRYDGSVLEHVHMGFAFRNVSRVFLAELNRHRGPAISERSLRYFRYTEIPIWLSPWIADVPHLKQAALDLLARMEVFQQSVVDHYRLDEPSTSFTKKKLVTSAARRLIPLGVASATTWTVNIRLLRWAIEQRTSLEAEEEIRFVFDKVAQKAVAREPLFFQDFSRDNDGVWKPKFSKI